MKAKTASASKKKAGAAKKKPLAAPKKKAAAPAKEKPASLAQQKRELHKLVMEFVTASFPKRRVAYFVSADERKGRAYIMCFVIENEAGFYRLDWGWHCSLADAQAETGMMNKKLGLSEEEVNKIMISTMGPVRKKK